jgi:hypothetical protein
MNHARISWLAALLVAGSVFPAHADSWYPRECRPDYDCAPIEKLTWHVPVGGGTPQLIVTSKNGKAVVPQSFPVRESKDGRSHVCMRYDPFGTMEVICLFRAPGP